MMSLVNHLDRLLYPGVTGHWDDQLFREHLLRFIGPTTSVLDIGAGAGIVTEMNFRGVAGKVCGVDPDERVLENPFLDEAHVGTGEQIPYPDSCFDVVFADNVLEHLPDPDVVFAEICRVLRPGGVFLAKTPNRRHYMPLIARVTPHGFHRFINRLRGRAEVDTFPTCYRANTRNIIRRLAARNGFSPLSLELFEGRPEYLRITAPTYIVGWLYERLVNGVRALEPFRVLLVITLKKMPPDVNATR